jgi:hypothetical protein
MAWPSLVREWGSSPAERAFPYPCDGHLPDPDDTMFRAIDVDAPQPVTFRWLCQLRVDPYSYDILDNLGRQSPRELTPGLEKLEEGQRFMTIFRLAEFEPGRSLTLVSDGRVFGRVACTYKADALDDRRSRIVVKLVVAYPGLPHGPLLRLLGAPGDFLMMRRQLLNLRRLAEITAIETKGALVDA